MVDSNFVPISNFKQHRLLEDMFAKTASTTCEKNFFQLSHKSSKGKLRKRSMSSELVEALKKEDV